MLIDCTNSKEEQEKEDRKKGQPIGIFLLTHVLSYKSPYIEWDTSYGIVELLRLTYNDKVAGTIGQNVNVSINCTGGGTLMLTGTATNASGGTEVDLLYSMNQCNFENTYFGSFSTVTVKLTITGTISKKGKITSSSSTTILNYIGTGLQLEGSTHSSYYIFNNPYYYKGACDFQSNHSGIRLSGVLCGKTF
ncbi:MAG: hypothetical protein L6Q54_11805 [Leptospiraceae bacterium]|nr:hypothetical protein [Leptospiraceae bacterium]MCK6381914.1 hypothetical protein [Leptospiraceae bacterium]NUM42558.1 hypothetical protein [Leptospiraceae bacterium]